MIEVYKILSGKYDSEVSNILQLSNVANTRGHSKKLYKKYAGLDVRKYSFTHRIVEIWNSLPESVVSAPTMFGILSLIV